MLEIHLFVAGFFVIVNALDRLHTDNRFAFWLGIVTRTWFLIVVIFYLLEIK